MQENIDCLIYRDCNNNTIQKAAIRRNELKYSCNTEIVTGQNR